MQAAQQTIVVPAMLKPKEERQVQELVSMGFDRGQVQKRPTDTQKRPTNTQKRPTNSSRS